MNGWLLLLPLTAALLGWLFVRLGWRLLIHPLYPKKIAGFSLQGLLLKKQKAIAKKTGTIAASFFSKRDLEEKITHPGNVKKIMPQAEEHIDHFLRVKLVKAMPVVGMFVGDKTITELKSLFMAELEALFPVIMKSYLSNLEQELDIEKMISDKILLLSPETIQTSFLAATRNQRRVTAWLGALAGFIIGLVQMVVMLLATP